MSTESSAPAAHQDLTTDRPEDYEFVKGRFAPTVASLVDELRRLADKVEAMPIPGPDQAVPGFGAVAGAIMGITMNAVNNLGLNAVVNAAMEADTALLARRLTRSVGEAEALRTAAVAAAPDKGSGVFDDRDPRVVVGSVVVDVDEHARDGAEFRGGIDLVYYAKVVAVKPYGYDVIWHGIDVEMFVKPQDVVFVDPAYTPEGHRG